jgi:hypothetical protein
MEHFSKGSVIGLGFLCFLALQSCESDKPLINDFVVVQNQKSVLDTIPIVERQQDSTFYWDQGDIEILLPKGANIAASINDAAKVELNEKSKDDGMKLVFKHTWQRTKRDSITYLFLTATFKDGTSLKKAFAIQWRGIELPDSLWQKVVLQPAKVGKLSMYPGESRSIQFVWAYPIQLKGLLKAEVADQKTTDNDPTWRHVSDFEKKKFTSFFVYGTNETARFRIVGPKGQKEVSFAVVSKAN